MKGTRNRVVFGCAVLGMVAFTIFLLSLYLTDYQLRVKRAAFSPPEAALEYEQLAAAVAAYINVEDDAEAPDIALDSALSDYISGTRLLGRLKIDMQRLVKQPAWGVVPLVRISPFSNDRSVDEIRTNPFPWDDELLHEAELILKESATVLSDIHRLAGLSFVAFTPEEMNQLLVDDPSPFFFNCASLLRCSAAYNSYTHRTRATLDDIVAGLRIADSLAEEPFVLSQDAGEYMANLIVYTVDSVFAVGELSPELALELAEALRPPTNVRPMLDALAVLAVQINVQRNEVGAQVSFAEWVERKGVYWGSRNWIWSKPICRPMTNLDDQSLLVLAAMLNDIPDGPYYQLKPHLDNVANFAEELSIICHSSKNLGLGVDSTFWALARRQATRDLSRLGILIERHHLLFGVYPASLADIDALDGPLPADPFTGESYRYVQTKTGFVVSSPGDDGVDDASVLVAKREAEAEDTASEQARSDAEAESAELQESLEYYPKTWEFEDDIVWRPLLYLPPRIDFERLQRIQEVVEQRGQQYSRAVPISPAEST